MSIFQLSTRVLYTTLCIIADTCDSCHRGKDCWFSHDIAAQDTHSNTSTDMTRPSSSPSSSTAPSDTAANTEASQTYICGICLERPTRFGIMVNCSHVFCLCMSYALIFLNYSLHQQMERQRRKIRRYNLRRVIPHCNYRRLTIECIKHVHPVANIPTTFSLPTPSTPTQHPKSPPKFKNTSLKEHKFPVNISLNLPATAASVPSETIVITPIK